MNEQDRDYDKLFVKWEAEQLGRTSKPKITKKALAGLMFEDGRLYEDGGFYAERLVKRIKFGLQKRIRGSDKPPLHFTLGYYPDMEIKEGREKAAAYRKECDEGNDPRKTIEQRRKAQRAEEVLDTITLKEVFEWWFVDMNPTKGRPVMNSTVQGYRYLVNGVSPKWWNKPVRSLSEELVNKHYISYVKTTGYKRQADSWVNVLRPLLKQVIRKYRRDGQKLIIENPFDVIESSTQSEKRQGFLYGKELHTVFESYVNENAYNNQLGNEPFGFPLEIVAQHNALTLLAFTGLRVSEILALKEQDYIRKGENLRGEPVEQPLLRVFIKKAGEAKARLKFIPVTAGMDLVVLRPQALLKERFLDSKEEEVPRGKVIRNYRQEWTNDYIFFSLSKKGVTLDRKLEAGTKLWRSWIGQPQVWKNAKLEQGRIDKNDQFSAHWLRHSFTTIAKDLGYDPDVDVARLVGKTVRGQTSQSGYSHDDAVDDAEQSRKMLERIQAYMITEAFQSRIVRQYFKDNKSEDIDLTDPSVPPDDDRAVDLH